MCTVSNAFVNSVQGMIEKMVRKSQVGAKYSDPAHYFTSGIYFCGPHYLMLGLNYPQSTHKMRNNRRDGEIQGPVLTSSHEYYIDDLPKATQYSDSAGSQTHYFIIIG